MTDGSAAQGASLPTAGPGVPADAMPRVTCLIVDDRAENLLALDALLRRDDVQVLQARSGTEALELLLAHDVALALLDVQMPEMDGFELAEIMRSSERTRQVPIIFVTAGAHDRQRIFKGYDTGAVDFLWKPIEPHILRSKAEVFYQLYRQKLALAAQLRERTENLRMNELFTAVLGHDLRSPLSAVVMAAHMMRRRDEEWVRKTGERLLESGMWMNRMINDMLDLARARLGGGISLGCTEVDLGEVVVRLVDERRASSPGRTIALHAQGDLRGHWDGDRLSQVVSNLLGNALHHGLPEAPITVDLVGTATDAVTMTVTNGGGISPEVAQHIFEPFRSGRRPSSRSDGLGLGLYIVDRVVAAHGGSIALDSSSELSQVAFTVTLPRAGLVSTAR